MGILKGALLVGAGIVAGVAAKKILDDYEADCHDFDDCDCCDDIGCCEECCESCGNHEACDASVDEAAKEFDGNGEVASNSENPDEEPASTEE